MRLFSANMETCSVQVPAATNPLVSISGSSGAPMKSEEKRYGLFSLSTRGIEKWGDV